MNSFTALSIHFLRCFGKIFLRSLFVFVIIQGQQFVVAVTEAGSSRSTIEFPAEIFISAKAQYSLYDLVEVTAADKLKLEALSKVNFDFTPYAVDPGVRRNPEKYILNQNDVVRILKNSGSFNSAQYHVKIPQQVSLQVFQEKILAIEVERKVKNHLSTLCGDCRFKISLSKMPLVKSSNWKIDFSNMKESGSFLLAVEGESTWVSGFVKTEKPVMVSQRDIQMGEELSSKDFVMESNDITYIKDFYLSPDQFANSQAAGHISAGTTLTSRQVKRKPDVIRGQQVQIFTGDDQLEVSATGVSEQEGIVGQVIRLKLLNNQKMITAEIISKGMVKIQ